MEYDYIIVGAGSAGCVLASRLSEDPSIKVALVETGGTDRDLKITMPAAVPFAYQSKRINWGYQSGPEPHLDGRMIDEKRGRVLGGSSSINGMLYNRGNPLDFDGWAELGLPNWDYAHCLPYFRKMETYSGGADEWRGGDGPMFISRCAADHKLHQSFLRAGEQAGYAFTPDHNGYKQEGFHVTQVYIHKGLRWTAARGYLRPHKDRSNLSILLNTSTKGLVIENGAAVGIKIEQNGELKTISATREVILSAGAFGSPQLLMLSGIGDTDDLRPLGIKMNAHVPAVGKNMENHGGVALNYQVRRPEDSLASEFSLFGRAKLGLQWFLTKKGIGSSGFWDTGAFLRTRDDVDYPDTQLQFMPMSRIVKNGKVVPVPGFELWVDLPRPESRGRIKLKSANPEDHPSIVFNHLESRNDVKSIVAGIRLAREVVAQKAWDQYRGAEVSPGADAHTDADLERRARALFGTSFHPCATCRMGTDEDSVVDSEGRVRGVPRLRVVDGSILPRIVTANISATIMMVAEKIADRILNKKPLPPSTAEFYEAGRTPARATH